MKNQTLAAPAIERAKRAVATVFVANGFLFATWFSRVPDVRDALGLTPGQLGLLLLCLSGGAVLALPNAGRLTQRVGAVAAVNVGVAAAVGGLVLAGIGAATGVVVLAGLGLFVLGIGNGIWDVAMNIEGATVERRLDRHVMPRFHAAFSLGSVIGALVGAGATAAEVPLWVHLPVAAAIGAAAGFGSTRGFLREITADDDTAPDPSGRSAWLEGRTLLIGDVVFVAAFAEGSANDWIAVAIVDGYETADWVGVAGFAAFVTAMTTGRMLGTTLLDRYGRVPVLWGAFACAGLGSALLIGAADAGWSVAVGIAGALIWGIGASLGFPVGMSAASDEPRRAAVRVSVVATIGYTAFLAGPPLLGFLGDRVGVLNSLLVLSVLVIPAMAVVPATRRPAQPPVGVGASGTGSSS